MNPRKLTIHELGIPQELKGLTSHIKRKLTSRTQMVPQVGQVIDIEFLGIAFDSQPDGTPKTPMAKIRYDAKARKWTQVSVGEAGLLVFYNTDPTDRHTKARVVSIIPNGRAVYVEPE